MVDGIRWVHSSIRNQKHRTKTEINFELCASGMNTRFCHINRFFHRFGEHITPKNECFSQFGNWNVFFRSNLHISIVSKWINLQKNWRSTWIFSSSALQEEWLSCEMPLYVCISSLFFSICLATEGDLLFLFFYMKKIAKKRTSSKWQADI